ncbi:MAG TPA: RT0821/Lpp0805 family surface protein [Gammaproteobacteria bacterium]|nr:RT0821/Lpp0805 family surface protein [Gammaproteobacteria bacterium]
MRKILCGILMMMTMGSVYAFNLSFLEYSPVYYFTKSDWAISEKTATRALDTARDNTKVTWNNPETKARGYFMPFGTTTQNGTTCRQMKIVSEAHQVTGQSVYRFCRMNGDWKISS